MHDIVFSTVIIINFVMKGRTKHRVAGCTVTLPKTLLLLVKGNGIKDLSVKEGRFNPRFGGKQKSKLVQMILNFLVKDC